MCGRRTLLTVLVCCGPGLAAAREPERDPARLVCGPRCVRHVLRHYGVEADLVDVIRQTQWPDIYNGSSLLDLRRTLESRAIHTRLVRVPAGGEIRWPHPSIVFFEGADDAVLGHFAVLGPAAGPDRPTLWMNRDPESHTTAPAAGRVPSDIRLITSPEPITPEMTARYVTARRSSSVAACTACCLRRCAGSS